MKVAVIGAGSWGTALARVLALNGHDVGLWARDARVVRGINDDRRNPRYLSDVLLSSRIVASSSYEECLAEASAAVVVTPSKVLREVARSLAPLVDSDFPLVICSKGVEEDTGLLPVEIFASELDAEERFAVLSGPNHAEEVVKQLPAATVVASSSDTTALFFQDLFANDTFRVYSSDDVRGVEICAAFKNVIAIAVGLSYGLGFGDNTAALLMTRGIAEMSRLVNACGGKALTCMGLAGTGDMIATCSSQHSRNRRFGESLAQDKTLEDFSQETHMVVEGALACRTIQTLADEHQVDLPITQVVRGVIWEGRDPFEAAKELAGRPLTVEFYGI